MQRGSYKLPLPPPSFSTPHPHPPQLFARLERERLQCRLYINSSLKTQPTLCVRLHIFVKLVDYGQSLLWESAVMKFPLNKPKGVQTSLHRWFLALFLGVLRIWPSAAEPKSFKTPKNNARNHRSSVILYWSTCVGKFERHLAYLGEISEQRFSCKRDWPWSTSVTNICKRTQRVGCLCRGARFAAKHFVLGII